MRELSEFFDIEFERAVENLDHASSVGNCELTKLGSTIGEVFRFGPFGPDPARFEIVKIMVRERFDRLYDSPRADPLNVFVKQEPHKEKKIKEGTFRLISAVSLVDTLVDRVLFSWLADRVVGTVSRTPSMVGWVPSRGGFNELRRFFEKSASADKSAWDWTVQPWMVEMWKDFIFKLAVDFPPWWYEAVLVRFDLLFKNAVFRFKDGMEIQQNVVGVMKSGCYLTIMLNTVGQVMLHWLAARRTGQDPLDDVPVCMGDDTLQRDCSDDYVEEIRKLGAVVKAVERNFGCAEFAGVVVNNKGFSPAYWQKHCYALATIPYENRAQALSSYQYLYAMDPEVLSWIHSQLVECDPSLIVPEYILRRAVLFE